jgi:hypothetical protein
MLLAFRVSRNPTVLPNAVTSGIGSCQCLGDALSKPAASPLWHWQVCRIIVLRGLASSVDPNGAALRALVAVPGRRPITHPPRLCGRRIRVRIIYTKRALPVGQRARGAGRRLEGCREPGNLNPWLGMSYSPVFNLNFQVGTLRSGPSLPGPGPCRGPESPTVSPPSVKITTPPGRRPGPTEVPAETPASPGESSARRRLGCPARPY